MILILSLDVARPGLRVGPAFDDDLNAISDLLRQARGDCLPLSRRELRTRLGEFEVARAPSGRVIGCASVRVTAGRAELRCLAVSRASRGAGVGRLLVERSVRRAQAAGQELFCVSRKPRFFESLGFARLPDSHVPQRPGAVADGLPPRCALVRRRPPELNPASRSRHVPTSNRDPDPHHPSSHLGRHGDRRELPALDRRLVSTVHR